MRATTECTFSPKSFLINNDGTAANPDGELDVIAASSVTACHGCDQGVSLGFGAPTGLALGRNQDVMWAATRARATR
jgi:hypothetical protein